MNLRHEPAQFASEVRNRDPILSGLGFREYHGWSAGVGWGWPASRRGMGLKLGGRRTEGLGRARSGAPPEGRPGAGLPPAEFMAQRRWLGAQPECKFLRQLRDPPPKTQSGGSAGRAGTAGARFSVSLRPTCTSTAPTLLGSAMAWGGAGAPVRPALLGMPPAPAPARSAARKACTQRAAAVATRTPGPRSRLQPPPAPLTAGRWRAAVQNPAKSRSHSWHVAQGSRCATRGLQMAW